MSLKTLFRGSEKSQHELTDNPFLNARKQWNFIMGDMVSSRQMWQFAGLFGLLIGLAGIAGMTYIGSQSKFVPYLVEVDKLGSTVSVGRADRAAPADERITRAMLASWLTHTRTVTTDVALQRRYIQDAYGMLNPKDAATAKTNEWFNGSPEASPFKRAETVLVNVEIQSVLRQSESSWQIDWVETTRSHDGNLVKPPQNMRGLFTIYFVPPTNEEQILRNPVGLYIKDYSWSPAT